MPKTVLTILVVLAAVCHIMLPGAAAEEEMPAVSRGTLEVAGRAAVLVKPDTAQMAFIVESNARQAADAVAENALKTETLLKALRTRMKEGDNLQTTSVSLQPVYDKSDNLRPSGYRVSNRVSLETVQMDHIGDFIDEAAASGAGIISSLQFRSSREADHRTKAAVLAVGRARSEARQLAQAAGVNLGRVLRIQYSPQGPPGVFYEKATLAMGRTPVEIGDLSIEADVTMVFEIQ
jgi:uncharacterized protein YggE